jgi:hypothetical protein
MEPYPYWKKITIYRINAIVLKQKRIKNKKNKKSSTIERKFSRLEKDKGTQG